MPTFAFTEAQRERFDALLAALTARGWLGPAPAPLANVDPNPPAGVIPGWSETATAAQRAEVTAFVLGWDWSPSAAARVRREAAARAALTATDHLAVALRAYVRDLYAQLGDLCDHVGRPRPDPAAALARVADGIATGADPAG